MAQYYAIAFTNYAKFKDVEGLKAYCASAEMRIDETEDGSIKVIADDCGWPSFRYTDDGDDIEIEDIFSDLSQFLADGQVLIFMSIGHENARHMDGHAHAQDNKGNNTSIDLWDILDNLPSSLTYDKVSLP